MLLVTYPSDIPNPHVELVRPLRVRVIRANGAVHIDCAVRRYDRLRYHSIAYLPVAASLKRNRSPQRDRCLALILQRDRIGGAQVLIYTPVEAENRELAAATVRGPRRPRGASHMHRRTRSRSPH